MSFFRYLRAQLVPACCVLLGAAAWSAGAFLLGAELPLILFPVIFALALAALALLFGWLRARRRLARLHRAADALSEKYLLGEVLERPLGGAEAEYYFVMKEVSRAAVDAVGEATRARDEYADFVEGWVHELKTPLTACSLILANGGDARKLRVQLRRADNLAESVLHFARLRRADAGWQIAPVDLRQAADEAVRGEMALLLAAGVRVEVEGEGTVSTDRRALLFILKQLLVNGAKYCRGGHMRIAAGGGALTVEDDGPGIAAHELPLIFGRGYVGGAGRRAGGGTGMGLYLVRETCSGLGIRAAAASEEGKFTRFTFTFPQ